MQLTPLLAKFDEFLQSQKSIGGSKLQNGISKNEIDNQIERLAYTLPPEVYELYQWRNGMSDIEKEKIGNLELFPWGIFLPLDLAITLDEKYTKPGYWGRKHFPLFTSGGGDFLLINCDPKDADYGRLLEQSHVLYQDELQLRYESLVSLFQMVLEALKLALTLL